MSPEQLAGKKVDGRSDLYSLGIMLFQMLAGVLPFRGDSMAELMHKIANEEAPDICVIRQELPLALGRVVALSLRKRTEARYQDGAHFAHELQAVLSALAGVGATVGNAMPMADRDAPSLDENSTEFEKTVVLARPSAPVEPARC